jgi:hypothetical protein
VKCVGLLVSVAVFGQVAARGQLSSLPVVESPAAIDSTAVTRPSLGRSFTPPGKCPTDRKAPTTVREALGSQAQRVVVHRYERTSWPSMGTVIDYVERILVGVPETGSLDRSPAFAEFVRPEVAGSVEFKGGGLRSIEFGNGYVHVMSDDGCEWWGRYLGPDQSKWIVRR